MADRYTVKIVRLESGERCVFSIDGRTGVPEPRVTAYSALALRGPSRSFRSLIPHHRGICRGLSYLNEQGIDLYGVVQDGRFLTCSQADAVIEEIRRGARDAGSLEDRKGISPSSAGPLIRAFCAYVMSLGLHAASAMDNGPERSAYVSRRDECVAYMRSRAGGVRAEPNREGLDESEIEALIAVLGSPAAEGPWLSEYVTSRNWALVTASLLLGWRMGEFLALRKCDLDFEAGMCRVVRRPDAADDPRTRLPSVKTLGRKLTLPDGVAAAFEKLLAFERTHLPPAWASPWVFTTAQGTPLSAAAVDKMFAQLCARWPEVGPKLSCHKLRHTWN